MIEMTNDWDLTNVISVTDLIHMTKLLVVNLVKMTDEIKDYS